jgi:hypothetical protein
MFVDIGLEHRSVDRDRRVANRAAIAALVASVLGMAGVVASAVGFRSSDSAVVHALVTAPLPLAVAAAAVAYRAQRELGALRRAGRSSSHRRSLPPQLYSSSLGASARLTVVSETCGVGVPTVESFTGPTAARFRSASNGAHSERCAGSVSACHTVAGG